MAYVNYGDYEVLYDTAGHQFDVLYQKRPIVRSARVSGLYLNEKKAADISDFETCRVDQNHSIKAEGAFSMSLKFKRKSEEEDAFVLEFFVRHDGVYLKSQLYDAQITGIVSNGAVSRGDVFPVCPERSATDVRAALGEAITNVDHALYNKISDTAVVIGQPRRTVLVYDAQQNQYTFTMPVHAAESGDEAGIFVREHVLSERYHVPFRPIIETPRSQHRRSVG